MYIEVRLKDTCSADEGCLILRCESYVASRSPSTITQDGAAVLHTSAPVTAQHRLCCCALCCCAAGLLPCLRCKPLPGCLPGGFSAHNSSAPHACTCACSGTCTSNLVSVVADYGRRWEPVMPGSKQPQQLRRSLQQNLCSQADDVRRCAAAAAALARLAQQRKGREKTADLCEAAGHSAHL